MPSHKTKPQVIAITGGIGSGKSTVRKILEAENLSCIDLDDISRQIVAPGTPGLVKISEVFGQNILSNGVLNRAELKRRIFSSPSDKQRLEAIMHPMIRQATLEKLNCYSEKDLVVVEIPLLTEIGRPDYVDWVVVCDCAESTQIARVSARDNMSQEMIQAIMANQATRAQRLEIADYVLNTELTMDELSKAVKALIQSLKNQPAINR
ncbi:dephospho-CoA kinase [Thiosulfativibrio zosterae]|nr:dephospho-CoA kinase [Thiosulfativibrio zosterae]